MTATLLALLILMAVVYHFRSPERPKRADPKPRWVSANVADSEWRSKFHAMCESPAEVAFVDALIDGFGLIPRYGALFSETLRIDLQVEQDHYRADFMANRWLVIEVDGAAWHGSEEAKARDAMRDRYFESLGYTVLRIPAKAALTKPAEAVRSVQEALAVGQRKVVEPLPKNGFERLAETGSLVLYAIGEINDSTARLREEKRTLTPAQNVFDLEKKVIEQAIGSAENRLHIYAYLDTDELRNSFEKFSAKLNQRLAEFEKFDPTRTGQVVVPVFPVSVTATGLHADEINRKFALIQEDRQKFLRVIQQKLEGNVELKKRVVENLHQVGCAPLASLITSESRQ